MSTISAIILAAGKGTRFKATQGCNKVAFPLGQKPMITRSVENLLAAGIKQIVVVVGFASASVKAALRGYPVTYAYQAKRLGTGHAVKTGIKLISPQTSEVITLYGDDSAFYPPDLFTQLIQTHQKHQAPISVITINVPSPKGLGRIIRNAHGQMIAIIEEKVATHQQKKIKEINTGLFCFSYPFLKQNLDRIPKNPVSGEYYLTDIVKLAVSAGQPVNGLCWPDNSIWHGVNTREELAAVNQLVS